MQQRCAGAGPKLCRRWGTVRPWGSRERFPAAWEDPLDLYGSLRSELTPPGFDSSVERTHVRELIRLHGAGWVWSNRQRLVSLRKFVSRAQSGSAARRPDRVPACEVRDGSTL
jgi:hypothetical protein